MDDGDVGKAGAEMSVVAVLGVDPDAVPAGLPVAGPGCDVRLIPSAGQLVREAGDADVVFLWEQVDWLREQWGFSRRLRWVAAPTAGVDWLLFPELVASDVMLTNAAGVFDAAMAEYTLALVAAICVGLPETLRLQARHQWQHRETRLVSGSRAVIVGAGGIGRAIYRTLANSGISVQCIARQRRNDPELGEIAALTELEQLLPGADFVILALPLTESTRGLFGAAELSRMDPDGWLINVGRGALADEDALVSALGSGAIGGAALDVFTTEPLPPDAPWWDRPNVIVSPHMSGDFRGWQQALAGLFADQLRRYRAGQPLRNVVDKRLGYVTNR
jgi:phosphoglycerate dehydrogenase-like enzyme